MNSGAVVGHDVASGATTDVAGEGPTARGALGSIVGAGDGTTLGVGTGVGTGVGAGVRVGAANGIEAGVDEAGDVGVGANGPARTAGAVAGLTSAPDDDRNQYRGDPGSVGAQMHGRSSVDSGGGSAALGAATKGTATLAAGPRVASLPFGTVGWEGDHGATAIGVLVDRAAGTALLATGAASRAAGAAWLLSGEMAAGRFTAV